MIARKGVAATEPPAKRIRLLAGKRDYFEQFMIGKLRFIDSRVAAIAFSRLSDTLPGRV